MEESRDARGSQLLRDPGPDQALVGATYLGLAAALAVGVAETFFSRSL